MSKRNTLCAIDVGTTKVCTIVAEVNEGGLIRVAGVGLTPSTGLHKGLVVNINEAKESIRESVRKAEHASGYKVESAYVGVTGRHISARNNRGVVAISRNDRLVRSDDLKRVLQTAQNVNLSNDERLLHLIPRGYAVDGQEGVRNPVGMYGFRLDVETHVITAAVSSVQNLVKCIRAVGVDIDDLVFEPLASSEAVLSDDEKEAGVILADIGGGTTDISVFKDGSIWHSAIIPVAGYQFTRDIAIGLGLPFEVAEEMKRKYGSVMPVYEGGAQGSDTIAQNGHSISYQGLCDVIRARVEELIRLIMLELPRKEIPALVPAGLVLTGGSSNLSGLDVLGRDITRMPVRIGTPVSIHGISEVLQDPAYATSVGLLLWGLKPRSAPSWKTSMFGANLRGLVSRIKRLFGS